MTLLTSTGKIHDVKWFIGRMKPRQARGERVFGMLPFNIWKTNLIMRMRGLSGQNPRMELSPSRHPLLCAPVNSWDFTKYEKDCSSFG